MPFEVTWKESLCGHLSNTAETQSSQASWKILFKIKFVEDHALCVSGSSFNLAERGKVNISHTQVNAVDIVWIYENWIGSN